MRIWKIASISSACFCILFFGFLCYQVATSDASIPLERANLLFGHWLIGVLSLMLYVFTFIVVLVSFPSFLVLCAPLFASPLWLTKDGRKEIKHKHLQNIYGLSISVMLLIVILLLGLYTKSIIPSDSEKPHNTTLKMDANYAALHLRPLAWR